MPFIAPNRNTRTEWLNSNSDSYCRTSSAASRAILLSGILTAEIMGGFPFVLYRGSADRAPRHLVRGDIRRYGDVHQDGLGGGCDFDSAFLEAPFHAAVEFALHRPAAGVG